MFARFTYLYFAEEKITEAKSVYMTELVPAIGKQKGNKLVLLLEPADGSNEFISYSLWEQEADAKAFEASDKYVPIISRIKAFVSKPAVQKYYHVND